MLCCFPPGATRVEFDPPSLRLGTRALKYAAPDCNEGRIRPSFIAAWRRRDACLQDMRQRGSNSTLLHCGDSSLLASVVTPDNEGRIRPSFIAASSRGWRRRRRLPTRVEFDPPSLRQEKRILLGSIRGATRVEFDPPSLRPTTGSVCGNSCGQRGSNSTLLHCGTALSKAFSRMGMQRGSNSTLLHCGTQHNDTKRVEAVQRGSNSTLLHCGNIPVEVVDPLHLATRVEFDPPSLRHCGL